MDSAKRVISGTWGEVWIDGEPFTGFAEATLSQSSVPGGKHAGNELPFKRHPLNGVSGTGTLTFCINQ